MWLAELCRAVERARKLTAFRRRRTLIVTGFSCGLTIWSSAASEASPLQRRVRPPAATLRKGAQDDRESRCSAVENYNGSREPLKRQVHSRASAPRGEALLVARRASQGAGEGENPKYPSFAPLARPWRTRRNLESPESGHISRATPERAEALLVARRALQGGGDSPNVHDVQKA